MTGIDVNIFQLVIQGGFAGLFVYLLFDTQRKSEKREDRLTAIIEKYADSLPKIVMALERIESSVKDVSR